jgi:hypothetical protein
MCRICVEWELGKLTSEESMNAIAEILNYSEDNEQLTHMTEVVDKILDKECPDSSPLEFILDEEILDDLENMPDEE